MTTSKGAHMGRIRIGLTALAIIALWGHPSPAWSVDGTVEFYVDGSKVGELECQEFPTAKPIKLAGRSGSCGTDHGSGLFDNASIEILSPRGTVVCDQDFTCFETGYWTLYGSPLPVVAVDAGNPAPCLMSAGDSWYDSGVASQALYDWSGGFVFTADVRVGQNEKFHGVEMGIADEDTPSGEGLGHSIGMQWGTSGAGELLLQMDTDAERVTLPGPPVGEWHTFEIVGIPSTAVEHTTWGEVKRLYR